MTALGYSTEQLDLPDFYRYLHVGGNLPSTPTQQILWNWTPSRSRVAFQSVAPLIMIGQSHGSGAMFGALIASGIYVVLVSGIFSKVANLFPSIVTGSVITTIGLTLIPVAIGNMGNNVPEPTGQSLLLAAITVLIILLINIFTKGFIKSISILIGLVVGTAMLLAWAWWTSPLLRQHRLSMSQLPSTLGMPTFEISSIVMMCIIATVSMVESTGVYLALSDITKDPIDSTRLRNGYRAEGLAVLSEESLTPSLTQDFHKTLVWLNCQVSRLAYQSTTQLVSWFSLDSFLSLVPFAQIIPSPVLGGAMLVMFGFVSIQGMQILAVLTLLTMNTTSLSQQSQSLQVSDSTTVISLLACRQPSKCSSQTESS